MKAGPWVYVALSLTVLWLAQPVRGDISVPALLEHRHCDACHANQQPLIGPPYRAIAARHTAQRAVMVEVLAQKIVLGGGGNWGLVPMVPNEHVSLPEARRMARWILARNDVQD
jgi:cytochrome c